MFSRWIMSCVIALALSTALLYGGVFYSGHLFLISIVVIGGAWSGLSMIAFPFLKLEPTSGAPPIGRRQSLLIVAVLLIGATIIDGLMSSRFESEPAAPSASSSASPPPRRRRGARSSA